MSQTENIQVCQAAVHLSIWNEQQANKVLDYLRSCEQQGRPISIWQFIEIQKQQGQAILSPAAISQIQNFLTQTNSPYTLAGSAHQSSINPIQQAPSTKPDSKNSFANMEPGSIFAHYKLESELGRGGMGAVYKALDTKLQRKVALKVILSGQHVSKKQLERFMLEAQSIAQIDHPNIIRMFDVGDTPQHYFTMEYIPGQELSDWLKKRQTQFKEMATIIQKVAEGLHVAHQKKIIHRDIKPSNIMVDQNNSPRLMDFGLAKSSGSNLSQSGDLLGTPAYMSPEQANGKEADKRSDIYSLGATLYEMLVGRSPYQGESVYNIVYQVMHKDPIMPSILNPDIPRDLEAICLKAMEKNPQRRYNSVKAFAQDLKNFVDDRPILASPPTKLTIFKKFIQRNKVMSTAVAFVFLTIVTAFIFILLEKNRAQEAELKAISEAKRAKIAEEDAKEKTNIATQQTQLAQEKTKLAQEKNKLAQKRLYDSQILLANMECNQGNTQSAIDHLKKAASDRKLELFAGWEYELLASRIQGYVEKIEGFQISNPEHKAALDISGDVCVFVDQDHILRCSLDSKDGADIIEYRQLSTQKVIWSQKPTLQEDKVLIQRVKCIRLSPNRKVFATAATDGRICLWSVKTGKLIHFFQDKSISNEKRTYGTGEARIVAFSKNQKYLLSYGSSEYTNSQGENDQIKWTHLWDLKSKKLIRAVTKQSEKGQRSLTEVQGEYTNLFSSLHTFAFLPNGLEVILGIKNQNLSSLNLKTKKFYSWKKGNKDSQHRDYINDITFSDDKKLMATAGNDGKIIIWRLQDRRAIRELDGVHTQGIHSCDFHPSKPYLVSAGKDKRLVLWDWQKVKVIHTFLGHTQTVYSCRFDKTGKQVISTDILGKNLIWDLQRNRQPEVIDVPEFRRNNGLLGIDKISLSDCSFHPNSKFFVTSSLALVRNVQIWDNSGKNIKNWMNNHQKVVNLKPDFLASVGATDSCDFSPDGRFIAAGGKAKVVKIYDLDESNSDYGKKIKIPKLERIDICRFHPHKNLLFVGCNEGLCYFLDIDQQKIAWSHTVKFATRGFEDACYSSSGRYTAIAAKSIQTKNLIICDNQEKSVLMTGAGINGRVAHSVAFHPEDEEIVALGDQSGKLHLYRWRDDKVLVSKQEHIDTITSCLFFRYKNQIRLITASQNGQITIWRYKEENKEKRQGAQLERILMLKGQNEIVRCDISRDKKKFITVSRDGTIKIWKINPNALRSLAAN